MEHEIEAMTLISNMLAKLRKSNSQLPKFVHHRRTVSWEAAAAITWAEVITDFKLIKK